MTLLINVVAILYFSLIGKSFGFLTRRTSPTQIFRLYSSEILNLPKYITKDAYQYIPQIMTNDDDILYAADLSVAAFFGEGGNFLERKKLEIIFRNQIKFLKTRRDKGLNTMIKISDATGKMVGFAELLVPSAIKGDAKVLECLLKDCDDDGCRDNTDSLNSRNLSPLDVNALMPKVAKLANVAVAKSHRRKGLGSSLVLSCVSEAEKLGYEMMILDVDDNDPAAKLLYRKLGFDNMMLRTDVQQYDISGLFLRMKRVPHVMMRRRLAFAVAKAEIALKEEKDLTVAGVNLGDRSLR